MADQHKEHDDSVMEDVLHEDLVETDIEGDEPHSSPRPISKEASHATAKVVVVTRPTLAKPVSLGDKVSYDNGTWVVSAVNVPHSLVYLEKDGARNQSKGKWVRATERGFVPYKIEDGPPRIEIIPWVEVNTPKGLVAEPKPAPPAPPTQTRLPPAPAPLRSPTPAESAAAPWAEEQDSSAPTRPPAPLPMPSGGTQSVPRHTEDQ